MPIVEDDDEPKAPDTLEKLDEKQKRRRQRALLNLNGTKTPLGNQAVSSQSGRKKFHVKDNDG